MIQAILLAAGSSDRFGKNKLMHPLTDGTPMALMAVRTLLAVVGEVTVVVRPEDGALNKALSAEDLILTLCGHSHRGMGASLACGVRATEHADAWIIALADMPFIRPSTINAVYEALREGAPLVAPVYAGKRGHPVGIGSIFREQLLELQDDFGARKLLSRNKESLRPIEVDDPGILQDIDIPADIR